MKNELKVLICVEIYPPHYSGQGVVAYYQARECANVFAKTKVLVTSDQPEIIQCGNVENHKIYYRVDSFSHVFSSIMKLGKFIYLNKGEIDVIHLQGFTKWSFVIILMGLIFRKKVVANSSLYGQNDLATIEDSQLGRLKLFLLSKCKAFISASQQIHRASESIADQWNIPFYYVPNSIAVDIYKPLKQNEIACRKNDIFSCYNIDDNEIVVLFSGVVCERKKVDFLIKSWQIVEKETPNATLVIVGPLDLASVPENDVFIEGLRTFIQENNLKKVFFHGELPHEKLLPIMQVADIFAFPSEREGLPLALLEAMACQTVPVLVRNGWLDDELVINWENGVIVEGYDPALYANALLRLINEQEKRVEMAKKTREIIEKKYNMKVHVEQYRDEIYL